MVKTVDLSERYLITCLGPMDFKIALMDIMDFLMPFFGCKLMILQIDRLLRYEKLCLQTVKRIKNLLRKAAVSFRGQEFEQRLENFNS